MKQVTQNWDRITKPLLQILLEKEIFFTEAGGGQWLTVEQAFFDLLPGSVTKHLLQRVMLAANFPVVSVPTHITNAIAGCMSFTEITAPLTREVLKRSPTCYKKLARGEKILLLQFCLTDCKFDALHGLELLPLSSGTFTTFSNQADAIYISSPEHPKELLPGLSHRFLDEEVNADIFQKLKAAAKQGRTLASLFNQTCRLLAHFRGHSTGKISFRHFKDRHLLAYTVGHTAVVFVSLCLLS